MSLSSGESSFTAPSPPTAKPNSEPVTNATASSSSSSSSSALYLSPLLTSYILPPSKKTSIYFDIFVFVSLFPCLIIPPLGLYAFQRWIEPELRRRSGEGRKKKEDQDEKESVEGKDRASASLKEREVKSYSSSSSSSSPRSSSPSASSSPPVNVVESAIFVWTWPSLWRAFRSTLTFSLPASWTSTDSTIDWYEIFQRIQDVICEERRYILHFQFFKIFRFVTWSLTGMLFYFIYVEDIHLTLNNLLSYTIRFYLLTAASFAAICSIHSTSGIKGYKAIQAPREKLLNEIRMKWISIPTISSSSACESKEEPSPTSPSTHSPDPSHPPSVFSPTADIEGPIFEVASTLARRYSTPQVQRATALQLLKAIDSMAKVNKAATLERRLVWICILCLLRGVLGFYSSRISGTLMNVSIFTSLLYGMFHFLIGFIFFGLACMMEFELHEDEQRWNIFTSIISQERCLKQSIPFYIPLASLGKSRNILGWFMIRGFLRDLKGKFDFARMETMIVLILIQMFSIAGLGLYWTYVHLGLPITIVYESVIGENLLVAYDIFLCLLLLLDMLAESVLINKVISSHSKLLLDEELNRSFALSSLDMGGSVNEGVNVNDNATNPKSSTTSRRTFASSIVTDGVTYDGSFVPNHLHKDVREAFGVEDSLHQIKALREKLQQVKEDEKLRIFGMKLDDSILTWLRGVLVSYGLVFGQSFVSKKVFKLPKIHHHKGF